MLAPLSEGKHSLHFTGTFPQFNFAINAVLINAVLWRNCHKNFYFPRHRRFSIFQP
jgi:hypothetical protein